MALIPGTRLGPYEVTAQIGVGGMGEVYRATDTNLKRAVAIKVLPESVAADAERLARFQREAEVLASLNHPNIAQIHGLEKGVPSTGHAGTLALVMELVEGPTLADRIAHGPIPVDEALPIAKQIAEALEAAHEQGIIHRDLKPANVKVRPDGTVKVLDFGLAKAMESAGSKTLDPAYGRSMSPTITTPAMTLAGMILGTAAYMSPEQARGKLVDKRADIWSFGCVLYEMLTGRRTFSGDDVTDTIVSVVSKEPDWTALPAHAPAVGFLLRRCLEKDPKRRLRDIGEGRLALEGAFDAAGPQSALSAQDAAQKAALSPARGGRLVWRASLAVAAVLLVAMAIPTVRHLRETTPPEMRVEIVTPSTPAPIHFALSPDGRHIVFVASGDGPPRLWQRSLDKTESQPMAGTDGAEYPFWSADSRSVGFFASARLYRMDIAGGSPQVLTTSAPFGRGGTWNADGTILFAPSTTTPVLRIAASGGEQVAVTRLDPPRQLSHRFPTFLPDGRHFLYYATGSPEASGIYLGSLDGGEAKRLTASDTAGAYLTPDHVVFMRQGALVSRRLDIARGELMGDPVSLADPVGYDGSFVGGFSVSASGRVAYRSAALGGINSPGSIGRARPWAWPGNRTRVASSIPNCHRTASAWRCIARCRAIPTSGSWISSAAVLPD